MWDDIVKSIAEFRTSVLSAIDASGHPYSVRCELQPDQGARVLRLRGEPGGALQPGPASILCHSHNEQLWNLKGLGIRGRLERDAEGWLVRPTQFIPDRASGSPVRQIKGLLALRQTAASYLSRRGEATPEVPWSKIGQAKKEGRNEARNGNTAD